MLMKKIVLCAIAIQLNCMLFYSPVFANDAVYDESDIYLLSTGMDEAAVSALDDDVKQFIVDDLKKAETDGFIWLNIEPEDGILPCDGNDSLNGITFTVSAFKSGDSIHIYPAYEFTTAKQPKRQDNFSIAFGNAFEPYDYGGQLWVFDEQTMSDWAVSGSLTANSLTLSSAAYSGDQLGSADWPAKFKGCAYCHAAIGGGNDKTITLNYLHNPNDSNFTIWVNVPWLGISYINKKEYSAAQMFSLSY